MDYKDFDNMSDKKLGALIKAMAKLWKLKTGQDKMIVANLSDYAKAKQKG